MFTLTLAGIAELAQVSRHTVTTWRARYGAGSPTPFPTPVQQNPQALFDATQVAAWLEDTGRTQDRDVAGDAPFYSTLFNEADHPDTPAALVHLARTDDWPADLTPHLRAALEPLVEAAYGSRPLLTRLRRRKAGQEPQLGAAATATLADTLAQACALHPSCGSVPLVAATESATALLADAALTSLAPGTYRAYVPDPDSLAAAELVCHSGDVHFKVSPLTRNLAANAASDIPADSIVVHIGLDSHADPAALFAELDDLQVCLDTRGAMLIVGPARLLIEDTDPVATPIRQRFLSDPETAARAPLRYSARLPREWSGGGGRLQPGVWVMHRTADPDARVALADHSGITGRDLPFLARDLVTALTAPEDLPRAALLSASLFHPRNVNGLRVVSAPDFESPAQEAPRVGDLWAQAPAAGLRAEDFPLLDVPLPLTKGVRTLPWDMATQRGKFQVLSVLRGCKVDPEAGTGQGGIGLVGEDEVLGLRPWNARSLSILELTADYPNANISEPGDVIVVPLKGRGRAAAAVDVEGSHVAVAPAFILRCKTTRGRSHAPLESATVPALVAQAITESGTDVRAAWRIPVIPQTQVQAIAGPLKSIAARRTELRRTLAHLEVLERDLLSAATAGTIAPEEEVPPDRTR
ncbi:hypothetical protein [uncultured Corynebacterium sp.]|uniref:hypothetical protein n=1 Tax=uncultured Corynebacterium sp. TaxID=159447 RepID=UPI0025CEA79F|nr:hypothetical protein [uncultured Corynebacterium sp.]